MEAAGRAPLGCGSGIGIVVSLQPGCRLESTGNAKSSELSKAGPDRSLLLVVALHRRDLPRLINVADRKSGIVNVGPLVQVPPVFD